jgi:hypothetical protein
MSKQPWIWFGVGVIVGVLGFVGGRALHTDPPAGAAFDYDAAAYEAAEPVAGFSKGGFSGFGELPGFEGRTVLGGRIVAIEGTTIAVESEAGVRSRVRVNDGALLRSLLPAGRDALRPGATLVVRRSDDAQTAEAILVVEPGR